MGSAKNRSLKLHSLCSMTIVDHKEVFKYYKKSFVDRLKKNDQFTLIFRTSLSEKPGRANIYFRIFNWECHNISTIILVAKFGKILSAFLFFFSF